MRRFLLSSMIALLPGLAFAQSDDNAPPPPPGDFDGGMGGGMMGVAMAAWARTHRGPDRCGPDCCGPDCCGMGGADMLLKFYAANTTHDGHLTLAQAQKAGFTPVVAHFADIDVKKHGFVTFYDIEAWRLDDFAKHLQQRADELRAED